MHEKWTKLCTASNYYRRPEGISLQAERRWKVPAVKASMMARLPQCSTLLRGLRPIFSDRTIKFYPGNRYSRINAHPVINFYFDYWLWQLFRSIRSIIRSRGTNIYVLFAKRDTKCKSLVRSPDFCVTNNALMTNFLKYIFPTRKIHVYIYIFELW